MEETEIRQEDSQRGLEENPQGTHRVTHIEARHQKATESPQEVGARREKEILPVNTAEHPHTTAQENLREKEKADIPTQAQDTKQRPHRHQQVDQQALLQHPKEEQVLHWYVNIFIISIS